MVARVGNFPDSRVDAAGRPELNSTFGERIVAYEIPSFNALFAYPSDTRKLAATSIGSGSVSQGNSELILNTRNTLGSKAIANEGNKSVFIERYKLNRIPAGTFTDKSTNSIMQYSTDAVIDLTDAELIFPVIISKSNQFFQIIEDLNFRMLPGDYVAYVITTDGSGELTLGLGWKELF